MEIVYSDDLKHAYFNGIEFYYHKGYFNNHKYGGLHRYIYEYYNGTIPKGYDVHHKDKNKMNNNISNLILLTRSEHRKLHNKSEKHPMKGKKHSEETKNKMSENHCDVSGEKNPMYGIEPTNKIKRTKEIINDIKNGIKRTEFMKKYNCSEKTYYNIKNETGDDLNGFTSSK